eukprot:1943024-Pyramimonas_sp.AAC.1
MEICSGREGRYGARHYMSPGISGFHGPRSLRCRNVLRNGAAVEPATARQRGSVLPEGTYLSRARNGWKATRGVLC